VPEETWVAGGVIVALASLILTFLAYRERRRATVASSGDEHIRQLIKDALSEVTLKHSELTAELKRVAEQQQQIAGDLRDLHKRIGAVLDRVAVLETKTEVFWRAVAMDAAKIIHSPDPRRAHIDALLESFMNGRLTHDQESELRDILAVIRDYEPGVSHLTFPVYPGEQIAAAILLRTLDVEKVSGKGGRLG
jgi:hypothetical protein